MESTNQTREEKATLGGGCFWCLEAVFQRLQGVTKVVSGYSGGYMDNPDYRSVCTGKTGHAEVCQIHFDPDIISFKEILEVFWTTHDPTTRDRQGNDVGPQYRSIILYHDAEQKEIAEISIRQVAQALYDNPIVTEVVPLQRFYPAETYHQNFYNNNQGHGYCRVVISPKVAKLRAKHADLLKHVES